MTPKEAITKLERLQEPEPWEPQIDSETWTALEMGIEALSKQEFPTQMSGTFDLVSRQYLLAEYDRQHEGPPGGARKIIEEAPGVMVATKTNRSETPNTSDLISRQAAIEALDKRFDNVPMELTNEILLLRADLRKMPTADCIERR